MKSHRLAIAVLASFLLACIAGGVALRHHRRLLYATPETESAFLRSYTPEHVIDRFREKESYSHTRNFGSSAGRAFVPHEAGFVFFVVLRREHWMPLMNTLRDDALQQLANNSAEVLSQSGDSQDGFRFDYKINQSIGSLRILPLATDSHVQRNMPLPRGMEDVTVRIEQTEKWYPTRIGLIRVSSTNLVH